MHYYSAQTSESLISSTCSDDDYYAVQGDYYNILWKKVLSMNIQMKVIYWRCLLSRIMSLNALPKTLDHPSVTDMQ